MAKTIEELGREAAQYRMKQSPGSDPKTVWEDIVWMGDELGRAPTADDMRIFDRAFREEVAKKKS